MLKRLTSALLGGTAPIPASISHAASGTGPTMQRRRAATGDVCEIAGRIFHGRIDCRPETRTAASKDFGHGIERLPLGVLFAKTGADIRYAVLLARLHGVPIAVRGQAHSAYGQSQAADGIVIDTRHMQSLRLAGEGLIDAGPGANWLDVAKFALTRGLTPPVMPDTSICLSVGGTLSVGGWGETTHRFGGQVDHVAELEVITGAGERVVCSPTHRRELFDAMRAGMGQCGIIVRARLKMVRAPSTATTQVVTSRDAADFVATMMARAGEPENAIVGTLTRTANGFAPSVTTHRFDVERPGEPKKTFWAYVDRNTQTFLDTVKSGDILRPHPYLSFFVPESAAVGIVQRFLSEPELTLGADRVVAFPYVRARFSAPFFALPKGERGLAFRIYRKAVIGDTEGHKRMLAANERFMKDVYAAGGTVYLPHAPVPTREQLLQHYGPEQLAAFAKAKRRYDPDGILAPHALPLR